LDFLEQVQQVSILLFLIFSIFYIVSTTGRSNIILGTPAYASPECIVRKLRDKKGPKSDVFSYGVILWELFTRESPWKGEDIAGLLQIALGGERLKIPENCPLKLKLLMQACWEEEPANRPSFADILVALDQLMLPAEWKTLFESAGATKSELENPKVTKVLIDATAVATNGMIVVVVALAVTVIVVDVLSMRILI